MDVFAMAAVLTWLCIAGIGLVVWFWKRGKEMDGVEPEYDERQIAAQGTAYKWSFYTVFGYLFTLQFAEMAEDFPLSVHETAIIGIVLMVVVYVTVAVWKDAYVRLREKEGPVIGCLSIIGIGDLLNWWLFSHDWVDLMIGCVFCYGVVLMLVRRFLCWREEKDGEC